jgi:signal transduction histidine kinase/ABC-type multidrug transport system ATPase subunit
MMATSGAEPLLSVSGLTVNYGALRALDGVSLAVRRGEVVALAGENGAGKTTLVRCIAGDIAPASGDIRLAGKPVSADPVAVARQGVRVVWQDLALCDNLDIAANLMLGRERRGEMLSDVRLHKGAASVLGRLGIPLPDTARSVRSLSGGQRQLVAVARALASGPQLLILDEPTASLGMQISAHVEDQIAGLREQGTTVLLACHDLDLMFRLADRIVVLRHGRVVAEAAPGEVHPDDVAALISGQEVDSSARRQLTRLHGLADRLVSADPSSSLSVILSALGAALGSERLCIHLPQDDHLVCAASLGMPRKLLLAWSRLAYGPDGGPPGMAAAERTPVVEGHAVTAASWAPFGDLARTANVASSWSVPVLGPAGLMGVITVLRAVVGQPERDDLDLVTLYAGYAASAIERDRLLDQATARNRVLETIREMLETLAGPVPVPDGLEAALQSLRRGLQADEVALVTRPAGEQLRCRAAAAAGVPRPAVPTHGLLAVADSVLSSVRRDGVARHRNDSRGRFLSVTFSAPGGPTALVAGWSAGSAPADATALLEDGAHSLRLALEREAAVIAQQEATTLRRSQELQRGFLSRLSHELRTPLTAIRGYASSLLQPDVTWDGESQQRFLARIAAESARLGRLVDDLLDFSAIESGILRLQRDWCDIPLVIEAAVACLPPSATALVDVACDPGLPVVWADHDRLEQVFVNLLSNALGHNPPGTRVRISAVQDEPGGSSAGGPPTVTVRVADDGAGLPAELTTAPFEATRRRRSGTAGAGLGLSIAGGIVTAHGGQIGLEPAGRGTCFRIRLPVEAASDSGLRPHGAGDGRPESDRPAGVTELDRAAGPQIGAVRGA